MKNLELFRRQRPPLRIPACHFAVFGIFTRSCNLKQHVVEYGNLALSIGGHKVPEIFRPSSKQMCQRPDDDLGALRNIPFKVDIGSDKRFCSRKSLGNTHVMRQPEIAQPEAVLVILVVLPKDVVRLDISVDDIFRFEAC